MLGANYIEIEDSYNAPMFHNRVQASRKETRYAAHCSLTCEANSAIVLVHSFERPMPCDL